MNIAMERALCDCEWYIHTDRSCLTIQWKPTQMWLKVEHYNCMWWLDSTCLEGICVLDKPVVVPKHPISNWREYELIICMEGIVWMTSKGRVSSMYKWVFYGSLKNNMVATYGR